MRWGKMTVLLLVFSLIYSTSCLARSAPTSEEIVLNHANNDAREIAVNPEDARDFYNRGTASLTAGRYIEALEDFNRATTLDPSLTQAQMNRGVVYLRLRQLQEAEREYTALISAGVQSAAVYANRGAVYLYRGDYGQALADYEKAAALEPENAAVHIGLGIAYAGRGDRTSAATQFRRATKLDVYYMEAFYNLGVYNLQENSDTSRAQARLPLAYAEYLNTERADRRAAGAILYRLGEAAAATQSPGLVVTYFDAAAQLGFRPLSLGVCTGYMPALVEKPSLQLTPSNIMSIQVEDNNYQNFFCVGFSVKQAGNQVVAVWQGQESVWLPEKWRTFQAELQQLPLKDWNSYYGDDYQYGDRGFVCSFGRQYPVWKLTIVYSDGNVLTSGGYFMKPSGFVHLEQLLEKYFMPQGNVQGGE